MFIAFSRPLFLISLSFIFLQMQLDNGRQLKKILSIKFFTVLSKLSFSSFLVFPIVASIFVASIQSSLNLAIFNVVYLLLFNLVFSFLTAWIVFMIVENPINRLFRLMFSKEKEKLRSSQPLNIKGIQQISSELYSEWILNINIKNHEWLQWSESRKKVSMRRTITNTGFNCHYWTWPCSINTSWRHWIPSIWTC